MPHNYDQYDTYFRWVADCTHCDWENRREREVAIDNSIDSHERRTGHKIVKRDRGPEDDDA